MNVKRTASCAASSTAGAKRKKETRKSRRKIAQKKTEKTKIALHSSVANLACEGRTGAWARTGGAQRGPHSRLQVLRLDPAGKATLCSYQAMGDAKSLLDTKTRRCSSEQRGKAKNFYQSDARN